MENRSASSLILQAIEDAPEIQAAGKSSLLAIAARALVPEAAMTREGLAAALGLHESLLCAILVSSDLLGDTLSRRELGRALFSQLQLRGQPPHLTAPGQLDLVAHCLEAALSLFGRSADAPAPVRGALPALPPARGLDGAVEGLLAALSEAIRSPLPAALDALEARAVALQRTKVVAVERNARSKLGVPTEEAIRRRAAQAVRATVQGLRGGPWRIHSAGGGGRQGRPDVEAEPSPHLTPTVAGELAAAIALEGGFEASSRFLLSLASFLDELPPASAHRRPGN